MIDQLSSGRPTTDDKLIDELDRLAAQSGYPAVLRCDNGTELACTAMTDWACQRIGLALNPLSQYCGPCIRDSA